MTIKPQISTVIMQMFSFAFYVHKTKHYSFELRWKIVKTYLKSCESSAQTV